jgi:hypothetical protein
MLVTDKPIIEWLPALVYFESAGNDWEHYLEMIYTHFKADFIDRKPSFKGQKVGLKRYPLSKGKEATFWHLTSTGSIESERIPDFRRCERICWPAPIIEHSEDIQLKMWIEQINKEERIHLLCPEDKYLLVLAIRNGYILPWTAFYLEFEHQVQKKLKKYEQYKKLMPPPLGTAS